tara:strand:+ start:10811 stop:11278 length:468 start_codon:yes stop_codon:yes gene_type:complete
MCLIIDVNSIPSVFDEKASDHENFLPIKSWIYEGKGKIIYGGSTFLGELGKLERYRRLFQLLSDAGSVVVLDKSEVDRHEDEVKKSMKRDCDDPHLIAIARVSKCKVICTKDARADKHIKDKNNYTKDSCPPKIYRTKRSAQHLINDKNCVKCCQ